jgi:hypothetical protein
MAAAIDASVGGTSSNSYITETEGDTYWDANYHNSTWAALPSTGKISLLIMATRILDDWIDWAGTRSTEDQALRWPRAGVEDRDGYLLDSDIIPTFLKNATAELASHLVSYNPSSEPDTKGYSEIRVDVIALKIDKEDRDGITVIPDSVMAMVEAYGEIRKRGGDAVVNLLRA